MTKLTKCLLNLAVLGAALAFLSLGTFLSRPAEAAQEHLFVLILDSETIDKDVPAVEQAASSHNIDPWDLIDDGDDPSEEEPHDSLIWNQNFPGDEIWLPTGQPGDEGVFGFPLAPHSNQNGADFTLEAFVAGTVHKDDLDKIADVQPFDNADLQKLIGHRFVGIVTLLSNGRVNLEGY